jgi:hypothetical protein
MNRRECTQVAVVVLACAGAAVSQTSLTIYNQDFAVVRQPLVLDLAAGTNEARVTDITARLEPDSVILRDPQGKRTLQILEQNYRADPISQGLLLSLYEGKEIEFLVQKGEGKEEIVAGKVIRSGYEPSRTGSENPRNPYWEYVRRQAEPVPEVTNQPVIEVEGRLRFSLPGQPLFPSLGDDTILKPTLHWVLQTDQAGHVEAEISYVTGGMSWEADYSMIAPAEDEAIDVIGWVTMDNQSGKTFESARIKLMAGDVSKVQEVVMGLMGAVRSAPAGRAGPAVSEKAFEEYHLYTLSRPTTLRDRETKQVEFLRAEGVGAQRLYVYDGARIDPSLYRGRIPENLRNERNYGTQSNSKVWVMREFKNSKENHLGVPLPKGRMRFYRQGDDRQLEFIGENTIDHTPRDETVRVYVGDAFDLVGERRQTDYQIDTVRKTLDETFEIKLRNRKEAGTVEIRVVEHLYRWSTWEITEKSDAFTKKNSQTIEFRVPVPAGGEKTITYKVHYTW